MLNAVPSTVYDSLGHSHPGIVAPAQLTEPTPLQCVLQTSCCRSVCISIGSTMGCMFSSAGAQVFPIHTPLEALYVYFRNN